MSDVIWSRRKKLIVGGVGLLGMLVGALVLLVGPWPNYQGSFETAPFFKASMEALDQHTETSERSDAPLVLGAGWSREVIMPPGGVPLAGYGARKGAPSIGIRDEVYVKALALSDGTDTAVVVGSDLLIVPENVADAVREAVTESGKLSGDAILFNASHNHSGPGGFAPGFVSSLFNGPFEPAMVEILIGSFVDSILGALDSMEPARVMAGGVDVPELIRNRERAGAPVDSELSYLRVEKRSGAQCILVSYSAHPTVIGSENLEITGEYPGFFMRSLSEITGGEVIYLAGAVGSMGHRAPEGPSRFERSERMGQALAEEVAKALEAQDPATESRRDVDVEVIGFPMELPPYQVRINRSVRFSKYLLPMLGVDSDGWLQGVRIGDVVLVGTPADYSGEISIGLKAEAREQGIDLWVLSFNGDYVGYISPDKYYEDLEEDGTLGYERGTMSWIGPNQEAYTTRLIDELVRRLFPFD